MGDITFNITKVVNLNKTVNLDINKNVDVNVNIDDLLATAEADAEAFGAFGLAEVDAYTYVREGTEGEIITIESPVQVDAVGNASVDLTVDPGVAGVIDLDTALDHVITIDHEDVDDINGFDHFGDLSSPPPNTPDALLPAFDGGDLSFDISDKVLQITGIVPDAGPNANEFTAVLLEPVVIDFGVRELSTLEDPGPYPLTITIAAGTQYLVEQLLDAPNGNPIPNDFEVEFAGVPGDITAQFAGSTTIIDFQELAYTQEAAGIGQAGEWNFDFLGTIIEQIEIPGGGGEAFAYAESTAAIDLV